jgi:hypothetical protein
MFKNANIVVIGNKNDLKGMADRISSDRFKFDLSYQVEAFYIIIMLMD